MDRSITRESAHTRRIVRRRLGILLLGPLAFAALTFAQSARLHVERDGDRLRLSAPQLHFLAGQPLEQLQDGRSVTYVFTVSLQVERGPAKAAGIARHVVFSYDLWEERFSVARVDDARTSASHLTAAAAEAWCMDLLSLPVSAAPADKTFVVKLDCTVREDDAPPADAPATTTLTGLIDLLSRKARPAPPRWEAVSPPLRLGEIKGRAR